MTNSVDLRRVAAPTSRPAPMRTYCFGTLALGVGYSRLALLLASDLAEQAPGVSLFVLTDHPEMFRTAPNVVARPHTRRSALGYNDKLCVVAQALKEFEACVFADADVRITRPVHLDPATLAEGLHAYRSWTWSAIRKLRSEGEPAHWKSEYLRMIDFLHDRLGVDASENDLLGIGEWLFVVPRGERTTAFLRRWNDLATMCERRFHFRWEGLTIGAAAHLTGMPIRLDTFDGLHIVKPGQSLADVEQGLLTREEYDRCTAGVAALKTSPAMAQRVVRRALAGVTVLRSLVLGLDLLS